MDNKVLLLAVLVIALLGFGLIQVASTVFADDGAPMLENGAKTTAINVDGSASVSVKPDEVSFSILVETLDDEASVSQSKNAEIVERLTEALERKGISEDDIKTTSYNIYLDERGEWTEPYDSKPVYQTETLGYRTSHRIQVTASDVGGAGGIIDEAVRSGATIESVYFQLSREKTKEYQEKLLDEAVKDARAKAETIAKASGLDVVRPVTISYSGSPVYPRYYDYGMAAMESAAPTSVFAGNVELSVYLSATFEAI